MVLSPTHVAFRLATPNWIANNICLETALPMCRLVIRVVLCLPMCVPPYAVDMWWVLPCIPPVQTSEAVGAGPKRQDKAAPDSYCFRCLAKAVHTVCRQMYRHICLARQMPRFLLRFVHAAVNPQDTESREDKGTQTQTFWSGYHRVGWGSSTWRGAGQKVRYVLWIESSFRKPRFLFGVFFLYLRHRKWKKIGKKHPKQNPPLKKRTVSGLPIEAQGNQTFWRDVPGFWRDIRGVPEKLEINLLVFSFRTLTEPLRPVMNWEHHGRSDMAANANANSDAPREFASELWPSNLKQKAAN